MVKIMNISCRVHSSLTKHENICSESTSFFCETTWSEKTGYLPRTLRAPCLHVRGLRTKQSSFIIKETTLSLKFNLLYLL